MASEGANRDKGLVEPDIAEKYMRAHQKREAKVRELLAAADDFNDRIETATRQGAHMEALRLEVAAVRAQVQAILVSFQIGEPDPEDEPES